MHDVAILGGGLAGCSLAKALAGLGWDVVVLERHPYPRHKVCGEFLSPESQSSLRALGLLDQVRSLGPSPMRAARLVSHVGLTVTVKLPGTAWGVSRQALDWALARAAVSAGADVRTGAAVTGVNREGDVYLIDLGRASARERVKARAVIAAWGRQPPLRQRPEPADSPRRERFVGVKCHFARVNMPAQVDIFLFRGGYAGAAPVEGGRVNFSALVRQEDFQRAGGNVPGLLRHLEAEVPLLRARLAGGVLLPGTECAVAGVQTDREAIPWSGFAQVGDAAAVIPPLCGDGQAMALRTAELCAPLAHAALSGRLSPEGWERAYRQAWHWEFQRRVRTGRHLQALLMRPGFSDGLVLLGRALPALAEYLVRATRGRVRPGESVTDLVQTVGGAP